MNKNTEEMYREKIRKSIKESRLSPEMRHSASTATGKAYQSFHNIRRALEGILQWTESSDEFDEIKYLLGTFGRYGPQGDPVLNMEEAIEMALESGDIKENSETRRMLEQVLKGVKNLKDNVTAEIEIDFPVPEM